MLARSPLRCAVMVALLVLVVSCADDEGRSGASTTATSSTIAASTSTSASTTSTTAGASSTTAVPAVPVTIGTGEWCATGSSPAAVDAERGLYAAWVTAIDVDARTIGVDVVQWLTGDEADDAYHEANPDDPDGVPNDYFIVNESTQVRTFDVADGVEVRVLSTGAVLVDSTFESLPTAFSARAPVGNAGRLSYSPFWIAVNDGEITGICEQYTP